MRRGRPAWCRPAGAAGRVWVLGAPAAARSALPGCAGRTPEPLAQITVDSVRLMEYRALGTSGLRVSVLTMGTMIPYWHQANTASDRLSPADLTLLGPHI
jgi:hypothetical protein